ncbi:MAG TPA: lysophospholipid acyltransferase family protein [Acetobacteraceae bacterium]|jgi:1-acyl-sn-glycerol-3-phosphate acyltransferase
MTFLRSALFNAFFFGATFALALYGTALRVVAPGRVLALVMLWARLMVWAARGICGIHLRVVGQCPTGVALIASKHESAFDTLVWLTLLPHAAYVVKRELLRIPLFGGLIRQTRMIAVNRQGGASALRGLLRDGADAAHEGRQIVIFPEGTRAEPGTVLPLQPGVAALATHTGLPVIPVVTDSGRCWSRRAFRKYPGVIHIVLLPPIPPGAARADLLRQLEAAFRMDTEMAARLVENSVG